MHDCVTATDGDGVTATSMTSVLTAAVGLCGCFVEDTDDDDDGVPGCIDACPENALKVARGLCSVVRRSRPHP